MEMVGIQMVPYPLEQEFFMYFVLRYTGVYYSTYYFFLFPFNSWAIVLELKTM